MGPFQIVAMNPPAHRAGSSKGSRVAKGKSVVKAVGRRGRKFLGLSMPVVETGVAGATGILATNYVTGLVIDKVNQSWMSSWYGKAGLKVAVAVGLSMLLKKFGAARWATPILAGGISSAALSVVKNFAPGSYDTRWGLAGDDSPDTIAGNNVSAELASLSGYADSADVWDALNDNQLSGLQDSAGIYAAVR